MKVIEKKRNCFKEKDGGNNKIVTKLMIATDEELLNSTIHFYL